MDADPGWKNSDLGPWIRDKHPGSPTLQLKTRDSCRWQAGIISFKKTLFTVLGRLTNLLTELIFRSNDHSFRDVFLRKKPNTKKRVTVEP